MVVAMDHLVLEEEGTVATGHEESSPSLGTLALPFVFVLVHLVPEQILKQLHVVVHALLIYCRLQHVLIAFQ